MFSRINHYLRVYRGFVDANFAEATTFRTNFFLIILMDLFFFFSALASVDILYNHVETIGVWGKQELLFFVSVMLCIETLHMTFISEGFWDLPMLIRQGRLDFILLKPIGSVFSTFFAYIRAPSMVNIFVTWAIVAYFGFQVDLHWTGWLLLPVLVLMGLILQASIEIVISCSMFWVLEGFGINFLRMQFQQLSRWPDFVYSPLARRVFTLFVPILLIGNAPVRFMLDYRDWIPMLLLVVSIFVSWALIRFFWTLGLR